MISVRRAFTGLTTTPILLQRVLAGSYDLNNVWVGGGVSAPVSIHATPLPFGNREDGILGDQLQPLKSGEREPSYMEVHSLDEIEINSYLTIYGKVYKITRKGNYKAAGYWATLGAEVTNATLVGMGLKVTSNGIEEI